MRPVLFHRGDRQDRHRIVRQRAKIGPGKILPVAAYGHVCPPMDVARPPLTTNEAIARFACNLRVQTRRAIANIRNGMVHASILSILPLRVEGPPMTETLRSTRRSMLAGSAALASAAILPRPARAATIFRACLLPCC
jgi:hypothetical protein